MSLGINRKWMNIKRCNSAARIQCRRANQQVFERDAHAAGGLFALYLPGELSDFEWHRIDHHVTAQFIGERPSTLTVRAALGPVDAVSQFDNRHRRKGPIRLRRVPLVRDPSLRWDCKTGTKSKVLE